MKATDKDSSNWSKLFLDLANAFFSFWVMLKASSGSSSRLAFIHRLRSTSRARWWTPKALKAPNSVVSMKVEEPDGVDDNSFVSFLMDPPLLKLVLLGPSSYLEAFLAVSSSW